MLVFDPGAAGCRWYLIRKDVISSGVITGKPGQVLDFPEQFQNPAWMDEGEVLAYVLPAGGAGFQKGVVLLNENSMRLLESCALIWPEQDWMTLELVRAGLRRFPQAKQVMLPETALFNELPEWAASYALPAAMNSPIIRRHGGDGLCHAWVAQQAKLLAPSARRVISLHLGDHPSLAAFMDGRAVECSQGFSPVDGIPSVSACGDLDPSLPLLLCAEGQPPAAVRQLLTMQSGWQAVAGSQGSLLDLLQQSLLVRQMLRASLLKAIGAGAAALGGVDALFCACDPDERWLIFAERLWTSLSFLGAHPQHETGPWADALQLTTVDSPVQAWLLMVDRPAVLLQAAG